LEKSVEADWVLQSVGRIPDLQSLKIASIGVAIAKHGGIIVDDRMRTSVPGIYAVGDCTNLVQLAHVASHQSMIAVDDILGLPAKMEYDFIPSVIFTTPEIAVVGKTEKNLTDAGTPYQVAKIPYGSNGKAQILNQPTGYVKLLRDSETQKLVGAAVFGSEANALIATLTLALQNNLSTREIKNTIFAHPTLAEMVHEAALSLDGEAIHSAD